MRPHLEIELARYFSNAPDAVLSSNFEAIRHMMNVGPSSHGSAEASASAAHDKMDRLMGVNAFMSRVARGLSRCSEDRQAILWHHFTRRDGRLLLSGAAWLTRMAQKGGRALASIESARTGPREPTHVHVDRYIQSLGRKENEKTLAKLREEARVLWWGAVDEYAFYRVSPKGGR